MSIDTSIRDYVQDKYDYLWDNHGIYIGTFRSAILYAGLVYAVISTALRVGSIGSFIIVSAFIAMFGVILKFMFFNNDKADTEKHRRGNITPINLAAIENARLGTAMRVGMLLLVFIFPCFQDSYVGAPFASLGMSLSFIVRSYADEIIVRRPI